MTIKESIEKIQDDLFGGLMLLDSLENVFDVLINQIAQLKEHCASFMKEEQTPSSMNDDNKQLTLERFLEGA